MKIPGLIIAALLLAGTAFGFDTGSPMVALSGTYVLVEHPKAVEAPDRIEFHEDGGCVLDLDGKKGVAGKYVADGNGNLAIDPGGGKAAMAFQYSRRKFSLLLTDQKYGDIYYAMMPDHSPKVTFNDLTGTYSCENEDGVAVTEVTPDHKFKVLLRGYSDAPGFLGTNHTYTDSTVDGTCSYADGVTTYEVEHTDQADPDQSVADVVIKRDAAGLWIVDAYRDKVICQPVAKKLELPAPPAGYKKGN